MPSFDTAVSPGWSSKYRVSMCSTSGYPSSEERAERPARIAAQRRVPRRPVVCSSPNNLRCPSFCALVSELQIVTACCAASSDENNAAHICCERHRKGIFPDSRTPTLTNNTPKRRAEADDRADYGLRCVLWSLKLKPGSFGQPRARPSSLTTYKLFLLAFARPPSPHLALLCPDPPAALLFCYLPSAARLFVEFAGPRINAQDQATLLFDCIYPLCAQTCRRTALFSCALCSLPPLQALARIYLRPLVSARLPDGLTAQHAARDRAPVVYTWRGDRPPRHFGGHSEIPR